MAELLQAAGHPIAADVLVTRLDSLHRSGNGVVLIAVEWGPPTGVVVVNWAHTLREDLAVAQIDMLLVAPEERRRGVGRLLLKAASQAARSAGCGSLFLTASTADDGSLQAFCEATGFDACGRVYERPLRKKV